MSLKNAIPMSETKAIQFYKCLFVGESKTGKTTAFTTFPGKKLAIALSTRTRPALRNCDCDLLEIFEEQPTAKKVRMNKEYSITPVAFDTLWTTVADLFDLAHSDKLFPYTSIMFDDLSSINQATMNHILSLRKKDGTDMATGMAGAPAEHHYMPQMTLMRRLFSLILNLPCHILVPAHFVHVEEEATGKFTYLPNIYGKTLRSSFPAWFDEVYETAQTMREGKPVYVWHTQSYGRKQFLGSTLNDKGSRWTSPYVVDLTSNGGFQDLLMKGGDEVKS